MKQMNNFPPIITEEYWANSQLSVVRYIGSIRLNNCVYTVVNKEGITVFELSDPKSKYNVEGQMIIQPGEPCDLVMNEWIPIYRYLGREKTIELIKKGIPLEEAKKLNK